MRADLSKSLWQLELEKTLIGGWMSSCSSPTSQIFFQSDFDFIVFDFEHTGMSLEQLYLAQSLSSQYQKPFFVRCKSSTDPNLSQYLDLGCAGIICPMINDSSQVVNLIKKCKFPPVGNRGAGLYLGNQYGENFETYQQEFNKSSKIFVQIEHKDAVPNLEKIFSIQQIDGFFIGPYDLSSSLGFAGQLDHPQVLEIEAQCLELAKKYGLCPGIHLVHPDEQLIKKKKDLGFRFMVAGTEFIMLKQMAKKYVSWK